MQTTARTHTTARANRFIAVVATIAIMVTGVVLGPSLAASAANYPSWSDVQKARNNETAKKSQVAKLEGLLTQLESKVAAAEKVAKAKGQIFYEAQLVYDEAAYKAEQLQSQADAAQAAAAESMLKAGQIAARLQRTTGNDLSGQLFFGEQGATDLLSQLGMATKVSQQSAGIYAKAKQDQNAAQSLTDQANVAKDALQVLADIAETAMVEAQAASDAAAAALAEQEANQARLRAQLATLKKGRLVAESEYKKGVEAAWGAGAGAAGPISDAGWTRPAAGYASASSFGPRVPPFGGASSWHMGTDIGAGCNQWIYSAAAGTVDFAGWNGGYGYFVRINHGNGVTTGYAHIAYGGIKVHRGQSVGPGMLIAKVGTTGSSNGCHLHFEVRQGGTATNPVHYLRAKGVSI